MAHCLYHLICLIKSLTTMKNLIYLLTVIFLGGTTVATADNGSVQTATSFGGYGKSFIFVEDGIEFSIFPDGQFDFYMQNYGPNVSVNINTPNASFSFNNGYDYGAYVQYDEFGAVIQIENTPIYYDWYGRVSQIGNVRIYYTAYGYVNRIGGLYIYYNSHRAFSHCTGYINTFNPYYVYRPWHVYYRIPVVDYCVVYHTPYRRYYTPVRYVYTSPYVNNYRRGTAVASRRGNTIQRSTRYATVQRAGATPRRDIAIANSNVRSNNSVRNNASVRNSSTRSRSNTTAVSSTRSNDRTVRSHTGTRTSASNSTTRSNQKVVSNTRTNRSQVSTRQNSTKNRVSEKPKNNSVRKYSSTKSNKNTRQLAQSSSRSSSSNSRSRR